MAAAERQSSKLPAAALLTHQREHERTPAAGIPMFAQINSLPGAELQPALLDRDAEAAAEEGRLNVRRHVVGPFQSVLVGKVLGGDGGEDPFEVVPDIAVGVFVDREGSRCVLQKDVQQSDPDGAQFRQPSNHVLSDQMKAPGQGGKDKRSLVPRHVFVPSPNCPVRSARSVSRQKFGSEPRWLSGVLDEGLGKVASRGGVDTKSVIGSLADPILP